jgi:hypothetical protein
LCCFGFPIAIYSAQKICSPTDPNPGKKLPAGMGKAGMQQMSLLVSRISKMRHHLAAL